MYFKSLNPANLSQDLTKTESNLRVWDPSAVIAVGHVQSLDAYAIIVWSHFALRWKPPP